MLGIDISQDGNTYGRQKGWDGDGLLSLDQTGISSKQLQDVSLRHVCIFNNKHYEEGSMT